MQRIRRECDGVAEPDEPFRAGQWHKWPRRHPQRPALLDRGLTGGGWIFRDNAGFQRFDGGVHGDNVFFTLGADTQVGGTTRLGFMIDYSDLDVTSGGTAVAAEAFAFGPYVRVDLNGKWSVDAFLTQGQTD